MTDNVGGLKRGRAPQVAFSALVVLALVAVLGSIPVASKPARAFAASELITAADYLPSGQQLPGAFQEQPTVDIGGLMEPDTSLRRVFIDPASAQTLIVEMTVGESPVEAQKKIDARLTQLVVYRKWRLMPRGDLGDGGYDGTSPTTEDVKSQILMFRVHALTVEIGLIAPSNDRPLIENVARLVETRMLSQPDAVALVPGFPATPQSLPWKEPTPAASASAEVSVRFTGSGTTVTPYFHLDAGLIVVRATHNGRSNFIVWLATAAQRKGLLVNEIGAYNARSISEVDDPGEYLLSVTADGEWVVEITSQGGLSAPGSGTAAPQSGYPVQAPNAVPTAGSGSGQSSTPNAPTISPSGGSSPRRPGLR